MARKVGADTDIDIDIDIYRIRITSAADRLCEFDTHLKMYSAQAASYSSDIIMEGVGWWYVHHGQPVHAQPLLYSRGQQNYPEWIPGPAGQGIFVTSTLHMDVEVVGWSKLIMRRSGAGSSANMYVH